MKVTSTNAKEVISEIFSTCDKYDFWENKVAPYGYWITVAKMTRIWRDYDRCTQDSQSLIRAEIRGFIPILEHWVEYANSPVIAVRYTKGEKKGQIEELHKELVDMLIEVGYAELV